MISGTSLLRQQGDGKRAEGRRNAQAGCGTKVIGRHEFAREEIAKMASLDVRWE
jgi:hypothetical protein